MTKFIKWQFNRFLFFGAANVLLSYVVYVILLLFLPYAMAYTLAYITGIFISYYLNARFVFKVKIRLTKALQYPLVYLVQYLLGVSLLYILVEKLQVSQWLAPVLLVLLTVPVTYLLSQFILKGRLSQINKG